MTIMIQLPDLLRQQWQQLAQKEQLSESELAQKAIYFYLTQHRNMIDESFIVLLDEFIEQYRPALEALAR